MNSQTAVSLSHYSVGNFDRGAGKLKEFAWLLVRSIVFLHFPFTGYRLKRWLLRCLGAKIGRGVVIKQGVKITFPWKLTAGDNVWLGEDCWILNLAPVRIDANACISQRAMLFTGSHNWSSPTFDLIVKPIEVRNAAWIAAAAFVAPGVTIGTHAVLTAGSVATKDLEPYSIYQGNPAIRICARNIE
jgi:putative colanic acid biosynthesis acetyltransferase WcaF